MSRMTPGEEFLSREPKSLSELEESRRKLFDRNGTKIRGEKRKPSIYDVIGKSVGVRADGGGVKAEYYQTMTEDNLPSEEQFRKTAQLTINKCRREHRIKKRVYSDIEDTSTDEFVIPCSFPSSMNMKEEEEEEREPRVSTLKIEDFLKMEMPPTAWSNPEDNVPSGSIDEWMIRKAGEAASGLKRDAYSICLSFETYPPSYSKRERVLRTIVIDTCALMKQVNFKYDIPWNYTGGATDTFKKNKLLIVRPLIELTMRSLMQGHRTVIILPLYYKNPIFAGARQKVDDVPSFNRLVKTGLVRFIEEADVEEMHRRLYEENEKLEGTWVSTSDLERIVNKSLRMKKEKEEQERLGRNENDVGRTSNRREMEVDLPSFKKQLTPFYYDNHLILPLHMSLDKKITKKLDLLYFNDEEEGTRIVDLAEGQMRIEEQLKLVVSLQDLYELPVKLMRGVQMIRRIVKEIDENDKDTIVAEEAFIMRELDRETHQAFLYDP